MTTAFMEAGGGLTRLEMRGVRKAFGATLALDNVAFSVRAGEVHALVGENGAGKSTLMKVLSGAVRPDRGEMWLDGERYEPRSPLDGRRRGVGMIYQELSLAPHLSVQDNILLGNESTKLGWVRARTQRARVEEALAVLGHPEIRPQARVGCLPTGAQQLVEIARALAVQCRVLVFDEPTSSLARDDVERLFGLIGRLRAQGLGIVYISHFLEEVQRVADRFTVLRDGRSVGCGPAQSTTATEIVRLMVGRDVREMFPRSARTPGDLLLEVRDLAGVAKPESASLDLRRGEVLGIAGLVGAGRTELVRALFGLDPVRRGHIRLGVWVGPASPANRLRQGMGLLSENRKEEGLATGLTVADNLTLSRLSGLGPPGLVWPWRQSAAAEQWIHALSIRCDGPSQRVSDLSGGNQQKVALARLLHHDVDVLLLDEPTRGIDVGSKAQIYQLIDDLAARRGKAILLVSSYLPELFGVCDRIAVMCRGVLGPARSVAALDEDQVMLEATGQV